MDEDGKESLRITLPKLSIGGVVNYSRLFMAFFRRLLNITKDGDFTTYSV